MLCEFTGEIEKQESNISWFYIVVIPKALIPSLGKSKNPRVIVTFNNTYEANVSIKSSGDFRFVVVRQEIRKKLKLIAGDKVHVKIEPDNSEYGMPMPEEFEAMLIEDNVAFQYFKELTAGKKRTLIHMVAQLKGSEVRIKKALAICEHLNEVKGQLDFKQLHRKIKEVNARFKPQ